MTRRRQPIPKPGAIPGRLLIVKMSAVGDVVMTLPALKALRQAFPKARIDWLVEPAAAGLLKDHPDIDRLIISPRRYFGKLLKSGRHRRARRVFGVFRARLRAVKYEVVLDLQGLIKSAINVFLSRGRRKLGFAKTRERTGWALNEKMPAYDPDRHATLRYLDAAVYLGAQWPDPLPEKYYDPPLSAQAEAETLLAPFCGHGGFVVLNPGAKWLTKRWPLEHWRGLADLCAQAGLKLVLTGGREDREMAESINEAVDGQALNLCGRTSLPVLAAVLARASAVVTADTGPMHLAAAVGGGGLALFGPTRPGRTGPFGGHFEILRPPLDCLGCLKKRCDRPCLELLEPESVWERLRVFLSLEQAS